MTPIRILILLFVCIATGCSKPTRYVVLTDQMHARSLTYPYGQGFVPQAKIPDDILVLTSSGLAAMNDAIRNNDMLTAQDIQKAMNSRDYRSLERSIVEFRFREIQRQP